jgi:hypothetical protein
MPRTLTTEQFIEKANKIHNNKYDYSKTKFVNSKTKVKIICPLHGEFEQSHNKHLSKKGCPKCGFISRCNIARSTSYDFITKAIKIHGDKYNYDNVVYTGKENKVIIICEKHGSFNQTPHNHLAGNGCPHCRDSKGEREINKFLSENNIKFIPQKRFKDCRYILPLPFDFYLPEHNMCIEYHGIQHFKPRSKFGGESEFKKVVLRDKIKVEYCINNNIKLNIIKYNDNLLQLLNSYVLK